MWIPSDHISTYKPTTHGLCNRPYVNLYLGWYESRSVDSIHKRLRLCFHEKCINNSAYNTYRSITEQPPCTAAQKSLEKVSLKKISKSCLFRSLHVVACNKFTLVYC